VTNISESAKQLLQMQLSAKIELVEKLAYEIYDLSCILSSAEETE
jgi:hypothetical protein